MEAAVACGLHDVGVARGVPAAGRYGDAVDDGYDGRAEQRSRS